MGPSAELSLPTPRRARFSALFWWLLFALAVAAILGGLWRSLEQYRHPTGFDKTGLTVGAMPQCVRLVPRTHLARAAWPSTIDSVSGACVSAVGDTDVALDTDPRRVGELLDGPADSQVRVLLIHERGVITEARFWRVAVGGWYDLGLLLLDTLVAALYAAAALLLWRRRALDPVSRRMSTAFLLIVHIGNGPVLFWEWAQLSISYLLALAGFLLMTVTLPAYPNGVYVPRSARWLRILIPVATVAVFALGTTVPGLVSGFIRSMLGLVAIGVALLLVRYRRMPAGLEKQQVKWAVFGLSAGLLLIIVSAQVPKPAALAAANLEAFNWLTATAAIVNQIGYGLIPAGILVSLLQYRLNDADAAAGKSLGYAIVTVLVGVLWALVQSVVSDIAKRWSGDPMATTAITTLIAALFFTPARTYVLAWTEAKFQPALVRLRALPAKLLRWQTCHTPEELARAALADLVSGVGAAYAVILGDDGREWRVLGAQGIEADAAAARLALERPADRGADPFPIRLELAEELDQPDLLAIGPRSDGASFTKDERSAIATIVEPLSNALQAAALRERHIRVVENTLVGLDGRLTKLEQRLAAPGKPGA